ncbi:Ferrous iron permease EfeU precursor [Vibrio ruber DSM 16370]|uniref:Ferrous iron permease EfeU n=1 Tax=Vibrio ruber (strain DSM 16370 / JCM 11486 / BCRC 17186 / CECT 7878 / LMG 23124 / VR1) TaxID=1123498 RepID=A0A1R4LEB7_VIBR1|nr:FTR1 family protein [Vibrio ruber]SJN54890.1 Ferrous iron permease EfeU precursor [Vibrio ruber DSM 16370]
MLRLIKLFIITTIFTFNYSVAAAVLDYQAAADDINARLDKTVQLYASGDPVQAKNTVQMAYFEVFEGLEGPIRINYSRQYAYQLEAKFGEIRKMISNQAPIGDVQQHVDWLKTQIASVPSILESGTQLIAETADIHQASILPYWREQVLTIERLVNQGLASYRTSAQAETEQAKQQKLEAAVKLIQQAQFNAYKNSDLETAIRLNRSGAKAAQYNDMFKTMIGLANQPYSMQHLVAFGYQVATLTQGLKDDLPGLPATRDDQQPTQDDDESVTQQNWQSVITGIDAAIAQAIDLYQQGQIADAMMAVQDTYFDRFESTGMENAIGARDTALKSELEGYFTRLVSLMKARSGLADIQAQQQALSRALEQGATMLGDNNSQGIWAMFIASLTIILREGLEALLIVAAITAYLVKNEHADKLYIIKNSVVVGVGLSLITAALFQWLFTNAGASREMLEGVTMLIAVVVLFMMSYWLLSKVEATHWKQYLENKLSRSLTAGSIVGLWFASFLAVYREGAETVLFYYALGADGSSDSLIGIFGGLGVGIVILTIIFFLMRYSVVKLPLKPFFIFTGGLMYLMAFVFAGKGVLELIEAKVFNPTLIEAVPQISLLGVYPYVETLIPQVALVAAAILALIVIQRQGKQIA